MNIIEASKQWQQRPADERFWTILDAKNQAEYYKSISREASIAYKDMTAVEEDGEILLESPIGNRAKFTNYSFGQACQRIGAPAGYLRSLPSELVTANLNSGLKSSDGDSKLLIAKNGDMTIRAFTSEHYSRIWNSDVMSKLQDLESEGWKVPPGRPTTAEIARPATELDVLRNAAHPTMGIKVGDLIGPSGIYVSDHDMFVFMINEDRPIDTGSGKPAYRGFYVGNSEVGARRYSITMFLLESVCGNHIIWNASGLTELKIVHRGNADQRFDRETVLELRKYNDSGTNETEAKIREARQFRIAGDKDKLLEILFGKRVLGASQLNQAYDYAVEQADLHNSDPLTAWGFAQGITRLSQDSKFADDREVIDRAATKVISMAF